MGNTIAPSSASAGNRTMATTSPSTRRNTPKARIQTSAIEDYERVSEQDVARPEFRDVGDEELQFQVDGLVSSPVDDTGRARAFSRAVCVPFAADQDSALPLGGLEGKVQQLVADYLAAAAGVNGDDRGLLSPLAAHLTKHGMQVVVTAPPKPSAIAPLSTRSINAPFLVVSQQPVADDQRDATVADQNGRVKEGKETPQVVVVDPALREHLALAPATAAYQRALAAAAPEVFVGTRLRLARLVNSLGPAIAANFSAQGMEQPPWRRKAALLHRWASVEDQERRLRLQWADRQRAQQQAGRVEQSPLAPSVSAGVADGDLQRELSEVAWPEGMPVRGAAAAAAAEVVPIVGFEVGSLAVGREPWYGTEPGVFVQATFRRPSLADSEGSSSADSEEVVAGLSPVSIFRDAAPGVPARAKVAVGLV
ncbi:hypothetical protein PLESTB_000484500 [Pleodorina starrii]|uniref:Uncharacterized protein n=1 Tax=Pleodorina starrii TaxID=330485 RepID=A0A9W6F0E9_9CHLO|nr:hypothetical protein PLESTM_000355700 [Pleodorina starrii]GLC51270.1 hypothetical protein PLESTB_000484500 [Pleodorina starrii]GLC63630.1 hypothetical protein PLESTF_000057400 [Pleodorina starrii]